jgi:hypothetical protein
MDPKFFSTMANQVYASLWSKYRPAILQLMVASAEGPQQYKLFGHEFKTLNPKEKGYSFTLQAHKGKAVNNIKTSPTAQDLLSILTTSKKASELMGTDTYEFKLDKQFVLHVTKMPVAVTA